MDALALSRAIHAKDVSCVEVMNATLDHIGRINPVVNAIVSLQDRDGLLAQSRARDDQLARGEDCGWMHGFPLAVKDLTATKGIRTTQGSRIFKDFVPAADAIVVERMKRAGGIVIGKTNTPEFGLGSNTYNDVFGRTLNAYDQSKTAGGSSGGAGVALALRMLPVADGTDHGGSLRNPAVFNNVFGFRTSYGRVPAQGLDAFYAVHGRSRPDGTHGAGPRNAAFGAGRTRSAHAAVEPPGSRAVRRQPEARFQGRADRVVRRLRRQDAVRTRRARPVPRRAEDVRDARLRRRGGLARFPDRVGLAELDHAARVADRHRAEGALRRPAKRA